MNPTFTIFLAGLPAATENQFVRAIADAGPFAKLILLVILLFSVVSWGVIFHKLWQLRRVKHQNDLFLDDFNRLGGDFGALSNRAEQLRMGTLPTIFGESFRELKAVSSIQNQQLIFNRQHLPLIQNRMERVVAQKIIFLEKWLIFLATTANVCPFLGLLGTVWGVLGTFMTMTGLDSALTLKLIGPGISEALTTTIFGLAAAIPAVIGYNYYVNRVAVFRIEMEEFALRLIALLEKNILARDSDSKNAIPSPPKFEEAQLEMSDRVRIP